MKVPKISIKKDNNVIKYYVYRDKLENLSNDISTYSNKEPVGCVFNKNDSSSLTFIDNRGIIQEGVDKYFQNPITIGKPNVDIITDVVKVKNGGIVPYYKAKVSDVNKSIVLHYKVLCDNESGNVSDLSNLTSIEITQDKSDIQVWLEVNSNNKWVKVQDVKLDEYFDIYKPISNSNVTILSSGVYSLNENSVSFDNKYSRSNNLSIVSIPNPWHYSNDDSNYRTTKSFRIGCTIGDGNLLYSDIINSSKQYSPIDKMVIIRREDDGAAGDLSISDNGIIVKQIVRAGGIYTIDEIAVTQFNEENIIDDFSVVNFDNVFKRLNIIDNGVIHGKKYKYTFICYDHCGEESNKCTIINKA